MDYLFGGHIIVFVIHKRFVCRNSQTKVVRIRHAKQHGIKCCGYRIDKLVQSMCHVEIHYPFFQGNIHSPSIKGELFSKSINEGTCSGETVSELVKRGSMNCRFYIRAS